MADPHPLAMVEQGKMNLAGGSNGGRCRAFVTRCPESKSSDVQISQDSVRCGKFQKRKMPRYPHNPDSGQTDLMGAAYNGDADEVARILAMPCDINAQDSHGLTALMYGAIRGHAEAVKELIQHGADLEIQSAQRYTALMYGARGGHTATVQALLNAKADPDVHEQDDPFETPLTIAAWYGFLPIVRALVAAGADVSLRGSISQLPPEAIARRQGHHDISEFLLYHEQKPTP